MGLVSSIKELVGKRQQSARSAYFKSLSSGKAEQILQAAEAAGIPVATVEEHVGVIEKASQLQSVAVKFPDRQRQHAAAIKSNEQARQKLEATIKPLQQAVYDSAAAVEQADAAEREARNAVSSLVGLYNEYPQVLPREQAPTVVKEQIKADQSRQTEGDRRNAARAALEQAELRVGRAKIEVRNLGEVFPQPLNAPIFDVEEERRTRPDRLKAAMAELEAAQEDLAAKQDAYQQIQQAAN